MAEGGWNVRREGGTEGEGRDARVRKDGGSREIADRSNFLIE